MTASDGAGEVDPRIATSGLVVEAREEGAATECVAAGKDPSPAFRAAVGEAGSGSGASPAVAAETGRHWIVASAAYAVAVAAVVGRRCGAEVVGEAVCPAAASAESVSAFVDGAGAVRAEVVEPSRPVVATELVAAVALSDVDASVVVVVVVVVVVASAAVVAVVVVGVAVAVLLITAEHRHNFQPYSKN